MRQSELWERIDWGLSVRQFLFIFGMGESLWLRTFNQPLVGLTTRRCRFLGYDCISCESILSWQHVNVRFIQLNSNFLLFQFHPNRNLNISLLSLIIKSSLSLFIINQIIIIIIINNQIISFIVTSFAGRCLSTDIDIYWWNSTVMKEKKLALDVPHTFAICGLLIKSNCSLFALINAV